MQDISYKLTTGWMIPSGPGSNSPPAEVSPSDSNKNG